MRKIIFEIAVSLDGYIQGPGGELDWLIFDDEMSGELEYFNGFDTVFYGRIAYERSVILAESDNLMCEGRRKFTRAVNNMRKYVFSRTKKHVSGNAMVINDSHLFTEVKRIREEKGENIRFCGGTDILNTFINLDLVDEYILAIQPVILGSGKPLFKNSERPLKLKLLKALTLRSGVVVLHYIPKNRIEN